MVTSPIPSNGATGQSINTDLSWADGGGATSYDVYFNGEYRGNQSGTSYDPGTLTYSTTYCWRIDSKNSAGTTTGDVWCFTTGGGSSGDAKTIAEGLLKPCRLT